MGKQLCAPAALAGAEIEGDDFEADTASANLADFDLLERLGQGGTSIVYRAWQKSRQRFVALKMLRPTLDVTPDQVARFARAAETAARLRHPNFVLVHGCGIEGGRPFLVQELVEGMSLAQFLNGRPQPVSDAAWLVRELGVAMEYAHRKGIIHRDLKPANVLLSFNRDAQRSADEGLRCSTRLHDPIVLIADFDLLKDWQSSTPITLTGHVVGTPGYMAPEQVRGQNQLVGPRTDIYALGAILYEMLTGRPPFAGKTALETAAQVLTRRPLAPSELRPWLPPELEAICLKCLERQPKRRYRSARALADALEAFSAE